MKDARKFKNMMTGLGELYGKECTKGLLDLYWAALSDCDDDQVEIAVMTGIRKWKCFGRLPSPAEILDEISGGADNQAIEAWEQLQEAVRRAGAYASPEFDDAKIVRIVEAMGGWQQVCSWPVSELHFRRKEFLAAHRSLSHGGDQTRLVGLHEQHNAALNYDVPVHRLRIAGRSDGAKLKGNLGALVNQIAGLLSDHKEQQNEPV